MRAVVPDSVTPWTVAYQAPPSMGFSRKEYWSGSPFPSPEDLPDPGIEPKSPTLQADALPSEPLGKSLSHGGAQISWYQETQHKGEKPRLYPESDRPHILAV